MDRNLISFIVLTLCLNNFSAFASNDCDNTVPTWRPKSNFDRAREMVKRGFIEEVKKILLSPEISHEDICQFRRLFERDLTVKSRHYYTTRPNYDDVIKPRFFEVTKARRYEGFGRNFVHFVQFKCNQTGIVFGTLVMDDDYLLSDEMSAIAIYKTPQVVKDYLEEQRLKKKREAEELKKSSKRRRESKQTDEESSNGEA